MSASPPAAVLLHGFTGASEAWQEVRRRLPGAWRVHAFDLPGHGTAANDLAPSFEAAVDRMVERIERRIQGPAVLAAYSLGARLALGVLLARPRCFLAAVLIGVRAGLDPAEREKRSEADDRLARMLENEGTAAFTDHWQDLALFATQTRLPAATLRRQRVSRLAQSSTGLAWALHTLSPGRMPDYRPTLSSLEVPVTLMAGELDIKFCRIARDLADRLPHAEVRVVADAGHNLVLERPREVAQTILDSVSPIASLESRQGQAVEVRARSR